MLEKHLFIADLAPGQSIRDLFVIAEARSGTARNGPYWNLTLQDESGRVGAKIWSPLSQSFSELSPGWIALVSGQVSTYRDTLQVVIDELRLLDQEQEEVSLAGLIKQSATDPAVLLERLEALCKLHLSHRPLRKLTSKVLGHEEIRARLLQGTGAKAIHHAYVGGLLEHTLSVCQLCIKYCEQYPQLDKQILLTAAIFHDLGKAWELSSGLTFEYTDHGRLLGHIFLGLEILAPFIAKSGLEPELVMHLKHIILSHHGEYEYGSPRRPKTAEAMALHYADNMDAKMNQFSEVFAQRPQPVLGEEYTDEKGVRAETGWSDYQRSLERFLYLPAHTPLPAKAPKPVVKAEAEATAQKEADQCSLPLKE